MLKDTSIKDTDVKTNTNPREKRHKKRRTKISTGFIFSIFSAIAAVPLGIGTLIAIICGPDSSMAIWIGIPMFAIGFFIGLLAIASLVYANKHNNPEGLFIEIDQQTEKRLAQKNGYTNPSEVSKDAHLFFSNVELGNRDMVVNIFDSDDGDDGGDDF